MRRRTLLGSAVAAGGLPAAPLVLRHARAQTWPSRPITLIVPWPAGGTVDITMRAFGTAVAAVLGQPVVIDNRAGASGALGAATLATTAKPDGYTIAQLPMSFIHLPIMQNVVWDPLTSFSLIAHLSSFTFGIVSRTDGPIRSFADMVSMARAAPGSLSYATPGAGTSMHIGMERISLALGIKLLHVPFKGAVEANAAIAGSHTMLQAGSAAWKPLVESGELRLLCVWTAGRVPSFPEAPTLREVGLDLVIDAPSGVAGPKGMDPAIVARLADAFRIASDDRNVREIHARYDMPMVYLGPGTYAEKVRRMVAEETVLLRSLGLARPG